MASVEELGSGARPSSLLEILGSDSWEALRRHMTPRTYERGERLVAHGTLEPDFQVIVEGAALVSALNPQGKRFELSRMGAGDCIGEMALLTGEPASADIEALTQVTTWSISQAQLAALDTERSRLIEALSGILAGRLRRANDRLLRMHEATVQVVDSSKVDVASLVRLPKEMARAADARILVVAVGEPFEAVGLLDAVAGENVTLQVMKETSASELRNLLHRRAHEFDRIVLFAGERLLGELVDDAHALLRVTPEGGTRNDGAGDLGKAQVVLLSDRPWTYANVRELSTRLGRPVVGLLPPDGQPPHGGDAVAKLARVLTGRQVGVALGAGAAKGFAHIGVLRALDELRIPIDVISGSSIGAAIGAGYAAGLSIDQLSEAATEIAAHAMRLTVPLHSFLSNKGIRDELQKIAAETRFEQLQIPLAVVATDIYRRCEVTFTSGIVWPCVLASMAIPGIYPPLKARGSYLVDGGVLNPVPAVQTRDLGAGVVLGVRLTGKQTSPRETLDVSPSRPLTTETIMRAMEIMNNRISEISNDQSDVNVEVCLEGGGLADFKRGEEYMEEGYRVTMAAAEMLTAAIPTVSAGA